MKRYALTAIGRDRPGIVAAVARALYDNGCNIEDSSMTILEDEFAIILIMTMDGKRAEALRKDLHEVEKSMGLTIHLKEITGGSARIYLRSNYIITLHGADRTGLVYKTAEALARMNINITDLETKILPGGEEKAYLMLMEVYAPEATDMKKVEEEMERLSKSLGVTIKIKPMEDYEPL